jgi:hypothetical protein
LSAVGPSMRGNFRCEANEYSKHSEGLDKSKHPISTVADDVDTREAGLLANGIDACGGGQQRSNVPR